MDQDHKMWLDTVSEDLLPFVDKAIEDWNAQSDEYNTWNSLGWDERDELVRNAAR